MSLQVEMNSIWPTLDLANTAFVPLTLGKVTMVDLADYNYITRWKWHAKKIGRQWYARRTSYRDGKPYDIYLHRQLMRCPPGKIVHHRNRNGLDNRRINLMIMLREQHKTVHKNYDFLSEIEKS